MENVQQYEQELQKRITENLARIKHKLIVISGKGGTGKTTISGSLAVLAKSKVIADCDVDAPDLHLLLSPHIKEKYEFFGMKKASIDTEKCTECGVCKELCRFGAIKIVDGQYIVEPFSCEGCGVCVWNCPVQAIDFKENMAGEWYVSDTEYGPMVHAKLGIAESNSGKLVTQVRQKASEIAGAAGADFVIIDGPPGIGCSVIASLANTDLVLAVSEPTVSGIADLVRVLKLTRHFGIRTVVCLNKYDINTEKSREIEHYCSESNIQVVGRIPFDPEVTQAIVNGVPLVKYSHGRASQEITHAWETLKEAFL